MKIDIEFTLSYYDGPLEFFALLDGEFVYCQFKEGTEHQDDRTFQYWKVSMLGRDAATLGETLQRPPTGEFNSREVEWAV